VSLTTDTPGPTRTVTRPDVLGNGHAVGEGSGGDGAGADAAAGTSVGIPVGI
jgi:hypothetical protein